MYQLSKQRNIVKHNKLVLNTKYSLKTNQTVRMVPRTYYKQKCSKADKTPKKITQNLFKNSKTPK